MQRGELRSKIMEHCPVSFEDTLSEFLSNIEQQAIEIDRKLDISSVSDLDQVSDAKAMANDLAEGLY